MAESLPGGEPGICPRDAIKGFLSRFGKWVPLAPEFPIRPFDHREFGAFCRKAPDSGGGMDGWGTADLKWFPESAFWWISRILMAVEQGADWPRAWCQGRAAYLHKNPEGGGGDPPGLQGPPRAAHHTSQMGRVSIGPHG